MRFEYIFRSKRAANHKTGGGKLWTSYPQNGVAYCPFHDDRHPSMKVDKNYHCFACGVGGDVIDYTARMYGLSQYDAAKKLIEDFGLPIYTEAMSREEKKDFAGKRGAHAHYSD